MRMSRGARRDGDPSKPRLGRWGAAALAAAALASLIACGAEPEVDPPGSESMDTAARSDSPSSSPEPGVRGAPTRERFLQHALGTQGDVRLPALLLSATALLAVAVVTWKRVRSRARAGIDTEDGEDDER